MSEEKTVEQSLTRIAEFNATAHGLAELRQRLANLVVDVETPKGLKRAKQDVAELRTLRTTLEERRKELKAPILERGKLLDDEAKRITAEIRELEDPIKARIEAKEAEVELARLKLLEEQQARVDGLKAEIQAYRDLPSKWVGKPAAAMKIALEKLQANAPDANRFDEFANEAVDAQAAACYQLNQMIQQQEAHEAEQEQVRKDREKLAEQAAQLAQLQAEAAARAEEDARRVREEAEVKAAVIRAEEEAKAEAIRKQEAAERMVREEAERAERMKQQRDLNEQAARNADEAKRLKDQEEAAAKQREQERLANLDIIDAARTAIDAYESNALKPEHMRDLAVALDNYCADVANSIISGALADKPKTLKRVK